MSSAAITAVDAVRKRLEQELNYLRQSPLEGCSAHPKDNDLFEWIGTIKGPEASPYAGGIFHLVFRFPEDYPLKPPTVAFATKIYHPNIESDSGFIGLNILHQDWTPALTVSQILVSLGAFLTNLDPDDAVVPEIAHEYQTKRSDYEDTAREWTEKFAKQIGVVKQQRSEASQEG